MKQTVSQTDTLTVPNQPSRSKVCSKVRKSLILLVRCSVLCVARYARHNNQGLFKVHSTPSLHTHYSCSGGGGHTVAITKSCRIFGRVLSQKCQPGFLGNWPGSNWRRLWIKHKWTVWDPALDNVSPCFSCLKPKISKMQSKELQGHARIGVGLSFGKARPCDAAMLPRAGWHLTSWGLVGLSGCYETAPWIQERCAKAKFQSMLT